MSRQEEYPLENLSRSSTLEFLTDSTAEINQLSSNLNYKYKTSRQNVLRRFGNLFVRRLNFKIIVAVLVLLFVVINIVGAFSRTESKPSANQSFGSIKDYLKNYKNNFSNSVGNSTFAQYVPSYMRIGQEFDAAAKENDVRYWVLVV